MISAKFIPLKNYRTLIADLVLPHFHLKKKQTNKNKKKNKKNKKKNSC